MGWENTVRAIGPPRMACYAPISSSFVQHEYTRRLVRFSRRAGVSPDWEFGY